MTGSAALAFDFEADDGEDFFEAVLSAFGVTLSPAELGSVETLGDLEHLLIDKIEAKDQASVCTTQILFFRLRAAIRELSPGAKVYPNTPFERLIRTRRERRELEAKLGLSLIPTPRLWWAIAWLVAIIAVFVAGLELGSFWTFLGLGVGAGLALGLINRLLPQRWTVRFGTVGELAERAGAENLRRLNPDPSKSDVWRALRTLSKAWLPERAEPDRSTRFYSVKPGR